MPAERKPHEAVPRTTHLEAVRHARAGGTEASGGWRFGVGALGLGERHPCRLDALTAQQLVSNGQKLRDGFAFHCVVHTYSIHPVTLSTSL